MKHVGAWLVAWVVLFWLWFLLVGQWDRRELIAAAAAATVAATLGEIARTAAGVRCRPPWRWIGRAWSTPQQTVVDVGILVWALVVSLLRRKVVRGAFVARPFDGGDEGVRAWLAVAATFSPNAYVVEIDPERRLVLVHDLVRHLPSERPV